MVRAPPWWRSWGEVLEGLELGEMVVGLGLTQCGVLWVTTSESPSQSWSQ